MEQHKIQYFQKPHNQNFNFLFFYTYFESIGFKLRGYLNLFCRFT